jgi:hypothetical protein
MSYLTLTTHGGIVYTISPTGLNAIWMGDKMVASGPFAFTERSSTFFAGKQDSVSLLLPIAMPYSPSAIELRYGGSAVVNENFSLVGEDLLITVIVTNTDPLRVLRAPTLSGLKFYFATPPITNSSAADLNYLAGNPSHVHPSYAVPIGVMYGHNSNFGFSVFSPSHFARNKLFQFDVPISNAAFTATPTLSCYFPDEIQPGETKVFSVRITVGKPDLPTLLASYKAMLGPVQYVSDDRPAFFFASADQSWVTPTNPYGFNGDWRRFDKPEGVQDFIATTARPWSQGLMWILAGYNPRGAQYRPDFDIFPPEIAANLPALTQAYTRIGLATRPGQGVDRLNWTQDQVYDLSASNASQMGRLLARYDNAIKLGFKSFYLDSFGVSLEHVQIMQQLRARLGPAIPTYSEFTCDLMAVNSGCYAEWTGSDIMWLGKSNLAVLQMLLPGLSMLCKGIDLPTAATLKVSPLYEDWQTSTVGDAMAAFVTKNLVSGRWPQ